MSLTITQADDMQQENLLSGIYARDFRIACAIASRRDWFQTFKHGDWVHLREPRLLAFLYDVPRLPGDHYDSGVN